MTTQQRRPAVETEAPSRFIADNNMLPPTPVGVLLRAEVARILTRVDTGEAVRRRVVQETLSEALACTWRRRAAAFEWARPRPGDFTGNATPAELAERDRRLAAQALACQHKAELLEMGLLDFEGDGR